MAASIADQNMNTASPPPSPPPPPPEDSSPGVRASALQNAFTGALKSTLNKCSYDNFATCFPTPAEYRPQTLEMFHKDFTTRLSDVCKTEFSAIVKERNVTALLNSLDRLIHEARLRKDAAGASTEEPIPPHTLPPTDLVNAHLAPFLSDMRSTITSETVALEKRNEELIETIKKQRVEMEGLVGGLERVVWDLERSAEMVQGEGVQELSGDVKMMEEELKG